MALEQIYIKGARADRRVALSEAHPDHPGGEIFVVGDGRVVKAALTPNVAARIASGDLEKVEAPKAKGAKATKEEGAAGGQQADQGGSGDGGDGGQQTKA